MIFSIPDVLSAVELRHLQASLKEAEFVDGKVTAGWYAKLVKNNQQLPGHTAQASDLKGLVIEALNRNSLFQTAVRPRRIHSILFSRYTPGMSYGRHTDNALMGEQLLRSDVSFTIFLSEPTSYQGGELVIEGADYERAYKLAAGAAIIYPSSTLHRVDPVTEGTRLVAVGWVQSLIRDPGEREILFDLDTARRVLFAKEGKTDEFDLITKSLANLLRKWSE
jgi:PKHD-type hydroxylase